MYVNTMKKWLRDIFYNPGFWICVSIIFLLCFFPVITWGFALGLAVYYSKAHTTGVKVKCFPLMKQYCKMFFLRSFLMGLLDMAFFIMAVLSLKTVLSQNTTLIVRLISCIFLWGDFVFLLSLVYRYPLMIYNDLKLEDAIVKGILLTIIHFWNTLLISLVILASLLISFFAGIGIFVFFPASTALLITYNYKSLFKEAEEIEN